MFSSHVTYYDLGVMQDLFREQLKKHDTLKERIELNLSAQPRILDALTQSNVRFVPVRQKVELALQQSVPQ